MLISHKTQIFFSIIGHWLKYISDRFKAISYERLKRLTNSSNSFYGLKWWTMYFCYLFLHEFYIWVLRFNKNLWSQKNREKTKQQEHKMSWVIFWGKNVRLLLTTSKISWECRFRKKQNQAASRIYAGASSLVNWNFSYHKLIPTWKS